LIDRFAASDMIQHVNKTRFVNKRFILGVAGFVLSVMSLGAPVCDALAQDYLTCQS